MIVNFLIILANETIIFDNGNCKICTINVSVAGVIKKFTVSLNTLIQLERM